MRLDAYQLKTLLSYQHVVRGEMGAWTCFRNQSNFVKFVSFKTKTRAHLGHLRANNRFDEDTQQAAADFVQDRVLIQIKEISLSFKKRHFKLFTQKKFSIMQKLNSTMY